jgi:4-carboxymuconolactone decarboxylase
MTDQERLERGREAFKDIHGDVLTLPDRIDPESFHAHVMRCVYNDVWARKKMSNRERRLVVLGALAAQSLEFPLETHLKCALELGELDASDVEELMYVLGVYVGMPRTAIFAQILQKVSAPPAK